MGRQPPTPALAKERGRERESERQREREREGGTQFGKDRAHPFQMMDGAAHPRGTGGLLPPQAPSKAKGEGEGETEMPSSLGKERQNETRNPFEELSGAPTEDMGK